MKSYWTIALALFLIASIQRTNADVIVQAPGENDIEGRSNKSAEFFDPISKTHSGDQQHIERENRICRGAEEDRLQSAESTYQNLRLPACTHITLKKSEYEDIKNTSSLFIKVGSRTRLISNYNKSQIEENGNLVVCYPLSPQILTCDAIIYRGNGFEFRVDNHTLILNHCNKVIAHLGDFVIDSDGSAIACRERIDPKPELNSRCNLISLNEAEHDNMINGTTAPNSGKDSKAIFARSELLVTPNSETSGAVLCYPLTASFLNCPIKRMFDRYSISSDHMLWLTDSPTPVGPGDYFLIEKDKVVLCHETQQPTDISSRIHDDLNLCQIVSTVFLFLTLVYQLRIFRPLNRQLRCFLCHVISMLIMNICTIIRAYCGSSFYKEPNVFGFNVFFTVTDYIADFAAFCWLNVIVFDIFITYCNSKTQSFQCMLLELDKFAYYSFYAWGFSLVFGTLCGAHVTEKFLDDQLFFWAFYYGPISLVMVVTLLFFIASFTNRQTIIVAKEQENEQFLKLFMKLFVVIGVAWLVDIVIYFIKEHFMINYWYVSGAINSIRGSLIFFVYVFRKETLQTIQPLFSSK